MEIRNRVFLNWDFRGGIIIGDEKDKKIIVGGWDVVEEKMSGGEEDVRELCR